MVEEEQQEQRLTAGKGMEEVGETGQGTATQKF